MLLLLACGLFLPVGLLLEYKITVHKIKTGKAWIKSGKILKIEKKLEKMQEKMIGFFTFCVRKDTMKRYTREILDI